MFKRFTSIILLLALISSNFSCFYAYVGFTINHNYIAENLCVNKSRAWMHCEGKCYLMKKIKQAAENEKKQQAKDNLSRIQLSFFHEPFQPSMTNPVAMEFCGKLPSFYKFQYCSTDLESIFRPPKLPA